MRGTNGLSRTALFSVMAPNWGAITRLSIMLDCSGGMVYGRNPARPRCHHCHSEPATRRTAHRHRATWAEGEGAAGALARVRAALDVRPGADGLGARRTRLAGGCRRQRVPGLYLGRA